MIKAGDRVRVVERKEEHFDDYVVGETALVESVGGAENDLLWVRWETNVLGVDEGLRITLLFPEEVELVS